MEKYLIRIDIRLLSWTSAFCCWVYRMIGLNNFQLSAIGLRITAILFLVSLALQFSARLESVYMLGLICSMGVRIIVLCVMSCFGENSTRTGRTLNSCRNTKGTYLRLSFLLCAIEECVTSFLIYRLVILPFTITSIIYCEMFFSIAVCLSLFFASIEPEPPSESKLQKGLKKLKSIFSSAALPSPV